MKEIEFKYNEDVILNEALEYISSTYNQHYVSQNLQLVDLINDDDFSEAMGFFRYNAMKYIKRAGRKKNVSADADLNKAIHYIIFMKNLIMSRNTQKGNAE